MAKLLDTDEKRNNAVKGIFLILGLVALVIAALVYEQVDDGNKTEATENALIYVHVKGAVVNSGVYEVPIGTRVKDLDDYTGGFLPEADLDGVNLASFVKDGDEVYIPFKGSAERGGFDLNAVTYEELVENIDGIGKTYAQKIVDYRTSHGRFESVLELRDVLGESMYEKVRENFYVLQ